MIEKIGAFFKRKQGIKKRKQYSHVESETGFSYIVLNKPKATPFVKETGYDITVKHLLPKIEGLEPIGHNEDVTEGLVLFSNDPSVLERILVCEFVVKTDKVITTQFFKQLHRGVSVKTKKLELFKLEKIDSKHLRFEMIEEMDNQIELIFSSLGYHAIRVMRVRIFDVVINKLNRKQWRHLSIDEINNIKGEYSE